MHLKKAIIVCAAMALFSSSLLNVSAAERSADNYVEALKENEKKNLIINVEAYKAAYSDLAAAFGDNDNAYIEHYLTTGVFEGRTKGVLFDPLTYAESYKDVKAAFGNDISAIVNHYLTFGVVENRTLGTANGYEDIATAEKNGRFMSIAQRNNVNTNNYSTNAIVNGYEVNAALIGNNNLATDNSMTTGNGNVNTSANTGYINNSTSASSTDNSKNYQHTTSIYDNSTLLRVEYYDNNNKLFEYSDVTNYDKDTNSYTETVYRYDDEKQVEIATRTDTYVNGELVSSEKH